MFNDLKGEEARDMWRMLTSRSSGLKLEFQVTDAQPGSGAVHWEAWYDFSATGRKVHNIIEARFTLKDGKIATHRDTFDFWRWTRMALGASGVLLGWSPIVQNKVRGTARAGLQAFRAKKAKAA